MSSFFMAAAAMLPGRFGIGFYAGVAGSVVLEDEVMVGSAAVILQWLTVGRGAMIGSGAVVTNDVAPGVTVVGVPARPVG